MREIKARAKSIATGEWVTGYYVALEGRKGPHPKIYMPTGNLDDEESWKWHDVDASTVGQFTGLRDRNGVEIYEGDIVKVWHEWWNTGMGEFQQRTVEFKDGKFTDCFAPKWDRHGIEVIGNIYDQGEG